MADNKFTTLETQIATLLRTVAAINKAIEEEHELGNYTAAGVTFDEEGSDYSAYSGSSRSSSRVSGGAASSESESTSDAQFLSITPIVQYFVRESGIVDVRGAWGAFKSDS